jgi:hypothetical protein
MHAHRSLEPDCRAVHFDRPLTPAQLRRAADLIANRPDVELHLYELHMMKGLTDSSPIAAPTALRRFCVTAMSQLAAETLSCFVGHPEREELRAGTGRSTVNEQIKRMLPLTARRIARSGWFQ